MLDLWDMHILRLTFMGLAFKTDRLTFMGLAFKTD